MWTNVARFFVSAQIILIIAAKVGAMPAFAAISF